MRDVVKTNVKRQQSSKRQHRRTRHHAVYFMLVLVLVIGIGASLSVTLFFNVTDIIVDNATDTSTEDIVELSGICYQDNLVRLDTAIAAERIRASIAYAEKVTVRKQFPSTVVITVEKAVPVANIEQSYGYLLVSGSGRILEERKETAGPMENLLIVHGYNAIEGIVGMKLSSEDEKRDAVLETLTNAVAECNNEQIISLDMSDQSDILVQFGENVVFHMGSSTEAVYKLRLAAKTIEQINPDKKYRLTMVGNNQISVIPEESGAVSTRPVRPDVTSTTTTTTVSTE